MRKAVRLFVPSLLISMIFVPATAPAQAAVTCDYNAGQHTILVSIEDPVTSFGIDVSQTGGIRVAGEKCAGGNAVFNVDKITVIDNAGASVEVNVDLKNPFAPGFTNEQGDSDEIEFKFDLKGGDDTVSIDGQFGPAVSFRAGRTKVGGQRRDVINYNAADRDHDMVLMGVDSIFMWGSDHNDILSGRGGLGTGNPYDKHIFIIGDDGDDEITGGLARDTIQTDGELCAPCPGRDFVRGLGGADEILGYGGRDKLYGDKGADEIYGGPANDTVFGGEGDDEIYGEDGNDKLIGGKQVDACFGGAGADDLKNCENNTPSAPLRRVRN
jgi:RTX calcium-binding nonapeptide repeat (4 copies)